MTDAPTISVKGVGRVSVPPDRTVVSFSISALNADYAVSADEVNARVTRLRSRLSEAGIAATDLKTTSFSIERENEWRGRDANRQQVFVGWRPRHHLRLELPVDREKLNKAFAAIASNDVESSVEISFTVSDQALLRTKILEDATRTARRNAEVIAAAAGCKLGKALRIEYGWSEVRFERKGWSVDYSDSLREAAMPDFEPEDIDGEDSVTIAFELV